MIESKKQRVRGTGPSRKELPAFLELADVPTNIIEYLTYISKTAPETKMGSDRYEITKTIDVTNIFNVKEDKYKQILLQTSIDKQTSEFDYINWVPGSEVIKDFLMEHFRAVYRSRISVMAPHHLIPWHIDADTSVVCRGQICIIAEENTFDFETKDKVETLIMKPGKMYFINTGWKHQVKNYSSERVVLIFAFKFEDLKDNQKLLSSASE